MDPPRQAGSDTWGSRSGRGRASVSAVVCRPDGSGCIWRAAFQGLAPPSYTSGKRFVLGRKGMGGEAGVSGLMGSGKTIVRRRRLCSHPTPRPRACIARAQSTWRCGGTGKVVARGDCTIVGQLRDRAGGLRTPPGIPRSRPRPRRRCYRLPDRRRRMGVCTVLEWWRGRHPGFLGVTGVVECPRPRATSPGRPPHGLA